MLCPGIQKRINFKSLSQPQISLGYYEISVILVCHKIGDGSDGENEAIRQRET